MQSAQPVLIWWFLYMCKTVLNAGGFDSGSMYTIVFTIFVRFNMYTGRSARGGKKEKK